MNRHHFEVINEVILETSGLTSHDFELATPCDCPHGTDDITTSCSVRTSAIPSVTIIRIAGGRNVVPDMFNNFKRLRLNAEKSQRSRFKSKGHDPRRLLGVSYRIQSDASHDKNHFM